LLFYSFSWWEIAQQLGWSLLDLSKELDFFNSVDSFSVTLSRLLFAAYLVMAIILLINMLIALLSNTYQRVQVSVRKHWQVFFFQICHSQSVLISLSRNHPC